MKQKALISLLLSIILFACFSEQSIGKNRKQKLTSSTSNSSGKLTITKKKKTSYLKFRDEPQYMIINVDIDWPVSNNETSLRGLQRMLIDSIFGRDETNIDALIKAYCTERSGGKVVTTIPQKVKKQQVQWYQDDLEVKCIQVAGRYATFQIDENTFNGYHGLPTYRRYINYDIHNNRIIDLSDILDLTVQNGEFNYETKLNEDFRKLMAAYLKDKTYHELSNYIDATSLKNVDFTFNDKAIIFNFEDNDEGYLEVEIPKEKLTKFMTEYGCFLLNMNYEEKKETSLNNLKNKYGVEFSEFLPNNIGDNISFIGPPGSNILSYIDDLTTIQIFKNSPNNHYFKDNNNKVFEAPYVLVITKRISNNENIFVAPLSIDRDFVKLSNNIIDNNNENVYRLKVYPLYGEKSTKSLFTDDGKMLKDITLNPYFSTISSIAYINDLNALYFNGNLYSIVQKEATKSNNTSITKDMVGEYSIVTGKDDITSGMDGRHFFTVKLDNNVPKLYFNSINNDSSNSDNNEMDLEWGEINNYIIHISDGSVGAMDYLLCGNLTYSNGSFKGILWWRCITDEDENGNYRYTFSSAFPVELKKRTHILNKNKKTPSKTIYNYNWELWGLCSNSLGQK